MGSHSECVRNGRIEPALIYRWSAHYSELYLPLGHPIEVSRKLLLNVWSLLITFSIENFVIHTYLKISCADMAVWL